MRLWLPDKRLRLAFGDFKIDSNDGRVRLAPFSAAIFHKSKVPGAYPEISTITCDVAILTMDKPVTQYSELNGKKVIAVEMVGQRIEITNNRRTTEKNDDIDVLIANGPLFWEERQDKIWTAGVVCLTDHQAKPATVIRGKGMEMFLAKDSGPYHKSTKPASASNDTGNVEKIKLLSDVQMHFWTDSSSGFLGGTPNKKKPVQSSAALAEAKPAPKEKAHIDIRTRGPFLYDLTKETAWFESDVKSRQGSRIARSGPCAAAGRKSTAAISGTCSPAIGSTCNSASALNRPPPMPWTPPRARKSRPPSPPAAMRTRSSSRSTPKAWKRFGSEMFYRAGDAANGPMTILKGEPGKQLRTVRNGHSMALPGVAALCRQSLRRRTAGLGARAGADRFARQQEPQEKHLPDARHLARHPDHRQGEGGRAGLRLDDRHRRGVVHRRYSTSTVARRKDFRVDEDQGIGEPT